MKKIFAIVLSLCLVTGIVTGCSAGSQKEKSGTTTDVETITPESTAAENKAEANVIVDHLGITVTLPKNIQRVAIVELLPLPSVYAVYQNGNVENLVAMPPDSLNAAKNSILSMYAPDILNVSTDCLEGGELNMEELLKLSPDVVFYSGAKYTELFEQAGITAVGFSATAGGTNTIETLGKWIELLESVFQEESKVTGIIEYGREAENEIDKRLATLTEEERVRALTINQYTDSALMAAGKGTFGEYWSEATGSINVALAAEKNTINMEQVYEWNPEKIFMSTLTSFMPKDIFENTAAPGHDWSTVAAVQDKEVYKFPLGMHRWWPPSSDAPLSLWWIAKTTYPELFEDIDMKQMTKEYYEKFYGMTLSDEDLEWIFNPRENLGRNAS